MGNLPPKRGFDLALPRKSMRYGVNDNDDGATAANLTDQ